MRTRWGEGVNEGFETMRTQWTLRTRGFYAAALCEGYTGWLVMGRTQGILTTHSAATHTGSL